MQRASRGWRALTRFGTLLLFVPVLACSSALRGYDVAPNGLARNDERLRRMLAAGDADSALAHMRPSKHSIAPTDAVLRLLYQGTIAHYAGDYATSVSSFDSAAWLADDRTVTRVSREAASLFSSDRALPYEPDRTERLLNAYYAGLGYLRLNNPVEAAVEARRISFILQNTDEDVDSREAPLHGVLRYLTGVMYELAGNSADADVAYRNAAALLPSLTPPSAPSRDSGDVVLIIEDAFVAHRVQHSLTLVVGGDEHDRLHDHDRDVRDRAANELAMRVLADAFARADDYAVGPRTGRRDWFVPAPPESKRRKRCRESAEAAKADSAAPASLVSTKAATAASANGTTDSAGTADSSVSRKKANACEEDDRTYILRMAWPAYHADRRPAMHAKVFYGDSIETTAPVFASINDAVLAEYDRERLKILARTIARSAAKYALVKSAEDVGGDDNNGIGRLLGTIANVSTAVLEQADTRSWTLLPGSIGIARIRLPAGTHNLRVQVDGTTIALRDLTVRPGAVRVESIRNGP